ncbi:MAG: penicillin-insensitive murein endopeptidase, partial [Rhodobacteraceae bacterium]|nr:penicillin-insensitive murein endopeptidase [Paracoccaceae bacterium]
VTTYLDELKNPPKTKPKGPRKRTPREFTMADLPRQCSAVLTSD